LEWGWIECVSLSLSTTGLGGGAMGRVGDTASAEETARGAILRNLHEARVRLPNTPYKSDAHLSPAPYRPDA